MTHLIRIWMRMQQEVCHQCRSWWLGDLVVEVGDRKMENKRVQVVQVKPAFQYNVS